MIVRRGRPGLIGTMARTAVVAGTATAVSGGMQRSRAARDEEAAQAAYYEQQQEQAAMQAQMQQYAQQAAAQQAGAATAPAGVDVVGEIKKLADLKAAGALTEQEFAAAKAKLLA